LEKTLFYKNEMAQPIEFASSYPEEPVSDSVALPADSADTTMVDQGEEKPEAEYGDYVFKSHNDEFSPLPSDSSDISFNPDSAMAYRDSLYGADERGEYDVLKYKTRFTPDYVAGGVSYDTFFGLRGQ
jgi:hypothetical protein